MSDYSLCLYDSKYSFYINTIHNFPFHETLVNYPLQLDQSFQKEPLLIWPQGVHFLHMLLLSTRSDSLVVHVSGSQSFFVPGSYLILVLSHRPPLGFRSRTPKVSGVVSEPRNKILVTFSVTSQDSLPHCKGLNEELF